MFQSIKFLYILLFMKHFHFYAVTMMKTVVQKHYYLLHFYLTKFVTNIAELLFLLQFSQAPC